MEGWIKLHRRVIESDIYMMPPLYLRIFERMIIEANHQDNMIPYREKGQKIIGKKLIKRGERLTSIRKISEWISWYERGQLKMPNPKTIKTVIDWLVLTNMLEVYDLGNRKETHYKIVNYEVYQGENEDKVTAKKQPSNSQVTAKKQSADINKNVKNDKNEKNDKKKNIYAEFVLMTDIEYQKLVDEYGELNTKRMIQTLDNYKGANGKKYNSDYRAILNWVVDKVIQKSKEVKETESNTGDNKKRNYGF